MVKIRLQSPGATANATEWVSVCILIGLALVSVSAAVEHIRTSSQAPPSRARTVVRLPRIIAATKAIPLSVRPIPEVQEITPEPPKLAEIPPVAHDKEIGEADRTVSPAAAVVIGRQRDLPMLRDDAAFETWGGEFANGDSRLSEMIQAGALTSVQKGAKVRIIEVRGVLAHVEVLGQDRTGWIRSSFVGR